MNKKTVCALGLMSGTSADGLTLCFFDISAKKTVCFKNYPYNVKLQNKILNAKKMAAPELSELNFELGRLYAATALKFVKEFNIRKKDIAVIGSHGQTVWHGPRAKVPNTLQIGEASFLAEAFKGIPVVCNFRPADIAAGGSGAPLVPVFDKYLFGGKKAMLLNIGGISNITVCAGKKIYGFDIGPGNSLSDAAVNILSRGKKTYDKDGEIAASFKPDVKKAEELCRIFIGSKPPLSLERSLLAEDFVNKHFPNLEPKDVSTLNYLTALIIAKSVKKFILNKDDVKKLYLCGGGVYNKTLAANLSVLLPGVKIGSTAEMGLHPLAKEAAAFGYLAWLALNGKQGSCPAATGAKRAAVLGCVIKQ